MLSVGMVTGYTSFGKEESEAHEAKANKIKTLIESGECRLTRSNAFDGLFLFYSYVTNTYSTVNT